MRPPPSSPSRGCHDVSIAAPPRHLRRGVHTMTAVARPIVGSSRDLQRYLLAMGRFPILEAGEETRLARRVRQHDDATAAQALVTSHLRLVAKIAMSYRGYGLPI